MKICNAFVSNSSSSSFIVPFESVDEAVKYGLTIIPVSYFKHIVENLEKWGFGDLLGMGLKIKNLPDNCYITAPFDRDMAYEMGISYSTFLTDL